MGSYHDAADRAKKIRYDAAEKLLASGDSEGAIAAFEAMGDYEDAADRVMQIRYNEAAAIAAADWRAGAEAFDALGDYADAADQANALRYNAAAQAAAAGDWQSATEMYRALGDYSDSAEKVYTVRYDAAAKLVASQRWDEAIALYTELGDYADCRERISLTRYAEAEYTEKSGDYLAAAKLYAAMGSYKDAPAKVDAMYEKYFAGPAEAMAKASEKKNYAEVIQIMSWLDMSSAPKKYQYLTGLYQEACYQEGNRLFSAGKPYEAYAYYKQLPANYRAMSEKLQRPCYLILGTWEDNQGNRYIFREEGICNLNGETLYFTMDDVTVYTGETPDLMAPTHRVNGVNRSSCWLYDQRGAKEITLYLKRVTD